MTATEAAGSYIADRLEPLLRAPERTGDWRAHAIHDTVLEARQKQHRKPPFPLILTTFHQGIDRYSYGERGRRMHEHDQRWLVRAVDEGRTAERADTLAVEIARRLDPGGEPSPEWTAAHPGYGVSLCLGLQQVRQYEPAPAPAGEKSIRWFIGPILRIVVYGDGAD